MSNTFFKRGLVNKNIYGPKTFCRAINDYFLNKIHLISRELKTGNSIPTKNQYTLLKDKADDKCCPNITFGFGLFFKGINIGAKGKTHIKDALIESKEVDLNYIDDWKDVYNTNINIAFKAMDDNAIKSITSLIALEIAIVIEDLLYYLSDEDCEKLAAFMVDKMLSYIGYDAANSIYSLRDKLRLGLLVTNLPIMYDSKDIKGADIHVHPLNRTFRHSIKCLLSEQNLDWDLVNGKVVIISKSVNKQAEPEVSNALKYC